MSYLKKSLIVFILFFTLLLRINAQEVVASAGDYYEVESGSISWTLGEVAIETLSSDNDILTQGFQQSYFTLVPLQGSSEELNVQCTVYPVPATDYITVKISEFQPDLYLVIYNISGEEVIKEKIKSRETNVFLYQLPASEYILKIVCKENKITESYKIIKH